MGIYSFIGRKILTAEELEERRTRILSYDFTDESFVCKVKTKHRKWKVKVNSISSLFKRCEK